MADSFHFNISIISRGKGKSAVASAAYISCEKLTNEWDGVTHDYHNKKGLEHKEIFLMNRETRFQERTENLKQGKSTSLIGTTKKMPRNGENILPHFVINIQKQPENKNEWIIAPIKDKEKKKFRPFIQEQVPVPQSEKEWKPRKEISTEKSKSIILL